MDILIVSSEVFPFAKTGGLADVTGALARALKGLGHSLTIIMPYYSGIIERERYSFSLVDGTVLVPISNSCEEAVLYKAEYADGITVYFVKNNKYYSREHLYGTGDAAYKDNAERFIFFSRAIPEICKYLHYQPDIIHCHDWHTALVPVYLKTIYCDDPAFAGVKTVFTIHNLGYQGIFWKHDMHLTNLPWELFTPDALEFYDDINLLKGGVLFSDSVTTVSKTYCKEIQTAQFGEGLEGVMQSRQKKLVGIINGIDYQEWDPAADSSIKKNYTLSSLKGKKACTRDLLETFGLSYSAKKPVIGVITRLVEQKGIGLILDAIEDLLAMGTTIVLLGMGDKYYHERLEEIQAQYTHDVGVCLGFEQVLAHKIEAGADIFLMPSRYEPCGLNQMYSLRYGTIPVVKAVGGLNDTVKNYSTKTGCGNGFKFKDHSVKNMLAAVKKAVKLFHNKREWKKIIHNAMSEDNSWEKAAKQYVKLYRKLS